MEKIEIESKVLHPNVRFRISKKLYKISNSLPRKGDLVLDIRNGTYGIHDGKFKSIIAVKSGYVTEGVPFEKVKKLIIDKKHGRE